MAQIEKYFDGISEALDRIIENAIIGGMSKRELGKVKALARKIKPEAASLDYAIKLLNQEPKLVTEKHALADSCGKAVGYVCEIQTICAFADWPDDWSKRAETRLMISQALQYLLWVLTHAHQKACRFGYRK